MSNPNTPDFELKPASPLTCITYNLKDVNLLGGGQYNGQVAPSVLSRRMALSI